tara:strand:+ start:333 stop:1397 length:1065 start_codon:yes stop_codon:yes gene_type:complete
MAYTDIDDSSSAFQCKTYSGNGSTNNITLDGNSNLQPDMVWIKSLNQSGYNHCLTDSIRGPTKIIRPNLDNDEDTYANSMTSFNSNGFTLGSDASNGEQNLSGQSYVAWNWKAANGTASNSNGNITSTVSANTTAGFSIVSYTGNASNGATVGHGLGVAPQMVITKSIASSGAWQVLTNIYPSYSEGDYIYLNETSGKANSGNVSFLPTSTTWGMKSGQAGNTSGTKMAYCFAGKQGYSKFGNYKGNGSTNGTFVYTGFKPAWVLCKLTSADGYGWTLFDNKRAGYNENNYTLQPDGSAAQNTSGGNGRIDILSNGFKLRTTDAGINGSGSTYIFMAFAENPFVTSTGVAGLAR